MFLLLLTLMMLLCVTSAEAVVPQLWTFMQGMLSFLPQIALFVVFSVSLIFKWSTWKMLYSKWRSHPRLVHLTLLAVAALAIYVYFGILRPQPSAAPVSLADWPMMGQNIERTGHAEHGAIDGTESWHFREMLDRAPFNASPAVAGNRAYVGSDNGYLYCFDTSTGDVVWQFEAMYEVFSSPSVMDGRVYFGEGLHYVDDALFYCVDAVTGDLVWDFQTTSHTESSPTIRDGRVVFGAGEDGVYCLDAANGEQCWRYPGIHVDSAPLVVDGRVYVGSGYGSEALHCIDWETGTAVWSIPLDVPAWGGLSSIDGRVYVGIGNGNFGMSDPIEPIGGVLCVDAQSGDVLWQFEAQDAVLTSVAVHNSRAYFGSRDGFFYCIDAVSGDEIWRYDVETPILSSPALTDAHAYFGANDGKLRAIHLATGTETWQFDVGQSSFNTDVRILASPAISGGRLYIGSMNFFFYCLD